MQSWKKLVNVVLNAYIVFLTFFFKKVTILLSYMPVCKIHKLFYEMNGHAYRAICARIRFIYIMEV